MTDFRSVQCKKRVKTSYDRQIIALVQEISVAVAESNGDVKRMLIGLLEVMSSVLTYVQRH